MAPAGPGEIETPAEVSVIDTSSIIEIRRLPVADRRQALLTLTTLVKGGKLVFPHEVFGELDRGSVKLSAGASDEPLAWAKLNQTVGTRHGNDLDCVKRVLAKVPDVLDVDKTSGADEADPYVLGLALYLKENGHEVTVVSEERKDRPDKTSINTACGLLKLYCLPLKGLLRDHGLLP